MHTERPARKKRWSLRKLFRRATRRLIGVQPIQWCRVVMDRETDAFVRSLDYRAFDALEISGTKWSAFGFRSYRSVAFPDYDVCQAPLAAESFDIIIAEQVLEHVPWPYRAVRNIYQMLRPGGVFVSTTPFLIRIHEEPLDCSRWTETGIKHLLAEGGFDLADITTGSWGNRVCLKANFGDWRPWVPWLHSLNNERAFPLVVWAYARKR